MMDLEVMCGCGRTYLYNRRNRHGHSRTKCNSCLVNGRRKRVKAWAVRYKGGKCEDCGYCKCMRALEFHHTDPTKKDFNVNASNAARKKSSLQKELDKCVLVCANCHRERHDAMDAFQQAVHDAI